MTQIARADSTLLLNKNQPAPYTGILMPESTAQTARQAELDLPQYKSLLILEQSNNGFLNQKVNLLQTDNKNLSDSLQKQETSNTLEKVLIFLGGVAITGLAVYGAGQLYH